tara:strand:+ start:5971 stop:6471 length:501 start_codon:yes stop_codon:yes gene_type:complete
MNIFYVDKDPFKAAAMLPDKLVVKMPLESAQMLSTVHRVYNGDAWCDMVGIYKTAHLNHPCTIWARESVMNYKWLYNHFQALSEEYSKRYEGKRHASWVKLNEKLAEVPILIPKYKFYPPAQAMPDQYKDPDPVKAYRNYLINEKHYAEWNKCTPKPTWWVKEEAA